IGTFEATHALQTMIVDDKVVGERSTHPGQVAVVNPQEKLVHRPEGGRRRVDGGCASESVRVGGAPIIEVEHDDGGDPSGRVDLGQSQVLDLEASPLWSAGPQDALEIHAPAGGAPQLSV